MYGFIRLLTGVGIRIHQRHQGESSAVGLSLGIGLSQVLTGNAGQQEAHPATDEGAGPVGNPGSDKQSQARADPAQGFLPQLENFGWLYLIIIVDWYTKKIIGFNLDRLHRTQEWLAVLEQAVNPGFLKEYEYPTQKISSRSPTTAANQHTNVSWEPDLPWE